MGGGTIEPKKKEQTAAKSHNVSPKEESGYWAKMVSAVSDVTKKAIEAGPGALPTYSIFGILVIIVVLLFKAKEISTAVAILIAAALVSILIVVIVQRKQKGEAEKAQIGVPNAGTAYPPGLKNFCARVSAVDEDLKLYSFCCPAASARSEPMTEKDTGFFHAVIYHLWADPVGGSIKAKCCLDKSDNAEAGAPARYHLEIEFASLGYPSNVAIRPCGNYCLRREQGKDFLCLDIKAEQAVGFTFRLYDQQLTQWVWGSAPDARRGYSIESATDWVSVAIPLKSDEWFCFPADGNSRYHAEKPDFNEMIPVIVIELGSSGGPMGLAPGSGRIHIRNIRLATKDPEKLESF